MTITTRLLAMLVTVVVNIAAFATADAALAQVRQRELLAQLEPVRITVTAPRVGPSIANSGACPTPRAL